MSYFSRSSLRYAEPVGTIRVRKPVRSLGRITDIDGNEWDIGAISSSGVAACPRCELHPYFADTSGQSFGGGTMGFGLILQEWKPYRVEVVEQVA